MSAFKDMVASDIHGVFLDTDFFANLRTVVYDGETFQDIPVVITGVAERSRRTTMRDHAQGLYLATKVLHCDPADLGGKMPEKGTKIKVNDCEGGGGFFQEYYVAASSLADGLLRIDLEAIDE